jgi:hypothetical protein
LALGSRAAQVAVACVPRHRKSANDLVTSVNFPPASWARVWSPIPVRQATSVNQNADRRQQTERCALAADTVRCVAHVGTTFGQCTWHCGDPACIDLSSRDLGQCDEFMGYGVYDGECVELRGCEGVVEYEVPSFATLEECQSACNVQSPPLPPVGDLSR